MRVKAVLAAVALVAGAVSTAVAPAAAAAPSSPAAASATGSYTPISATRVLDTREHIGVGTTTPVASRKSVTFTVAGHGSPSVPTSASAVVLNLTATGATAGGYATAYAAGGDLPGVSNVNFVAGRTKPNLAIVPMSSDGKVSIYNGSAGTVHLLADLAGFYTGGTPTSTQQGAFGAVDPTRLLDTRQKIGVSTTTPVKPRSTVTFQVEQQHGVPTDIAAAALNITATGGTVGGYVSAYASGSAQPATSILNYGKAQTVPALAVVRTGGDGKVTLYNGSSGTVHLLADVQGYYTAGDPVTAGATGALPPARALSGATVQPGKTYTLSLAGKAGIPRANVSAATFTVTAASATRNGYLTVYQGASRPNASNLNFYAGQSVANLVAAADSSGSVTFYNGGAGTVKIYVDVAAYVGATTLPLPATSASHYVRAVSFAKGGFGDGTATGVGCADARANARFVLLDIGAQANDRSGVVLSATQTKITYDDLVTAIDNYAQSYQACASLAGLTIAVGTNNSGDFSTYPAADRGADWADKVIDALAVPTGVTFTAANDIEASFSSTQDQAVQWVTAYLSHTSKNLIYNGSLDGCPDTYTPSTANCSFGWTQAKYLQLTHNGSRIQVLPQIYIAAQARQWANLYRTSKATLVFAGSLTEHAAGCSDSCAMIPAQGWAFLYHGLSTVTTTPSLPVAADLDIID